MLYNKIVEFIKKDDDISFRCDFKYNICCLCIKDDIIIEGDIDIFLKLIDKIEEILYES